MRHSPNESWILFGDEVQCNLAGNGHACVLGLPRSTRWPVREVRDHKRMARQERTAAIGALRQWLDRTPHVIGVASFGKDQVRELGVSEALRRAFWRAVLRATGDGYPSMLIIDGLGPGVAGYPHPQSRTPRAEQHHFGVAAAGLLARELRDEDLRRLHARYPQYGFPWSDASGSNQRHLDALARHGLTPSHHERETLAALRSHGLEPGKAR